VADPTHAATAGEPPAVAPPHHGQAEHRAPRERRPTPWGRTALVLAVLMVVVLTSALAVNAPGRYLESTILALIADGLSVLALVAGVVGIIAKRDRGAAIAAVLIAVLGNPLVLLYGLGALT
jgi:hypothetical protein